MPEKLPHIFLKGLAEPNKIRGQKSPQGSKIPVRTSKSHAQELLKTYQTLVTSFSNRKIEEIGEVEPTQGVYVEFSGLPEHDLAWDRLDKSGLKLLNTKLHEDKAQYATVFISSDKLEVFNKKIDSYLDSYDEAISEQKNPKQKYLIESIEQIHQATVESIIVDGVAPGKTEKWFEVWLIAKKESANDKFEEFRKVTRALQIVTSGSYIVFPDRIVTLAKVSNDSIVKILEYQADVAELREVKALASFWDRMEASEQVDWAKDLYERLTIDNKNNVYICLLDTGVNNEHILLKEFLSDKDSISYDPSWSTVDKDGHGTNMAGIACYGDMVNILETSEPVIINHQLESVKVTPDSGKNPEELLAKITMDSISSIEILEPMRRRFFCSSSTSDASLCVGNPSSWSGAIDQLCFGTLDGHKRLFIQAAGNLHDEEAISYPFVNLASKIEDPCQAWNSVVIGGYTEKISIDDDLYHGCRVIAPKGGLCPASKTSSTWTRRWPIKPDVVFEGGNLAVCSDMVTKAADLSLLTTSHQPMKRQFDAFYATSAATAEAANFVAKLTNDYPDAWPETLRGLLVHSADWTEEMYKQAEADPSNRKSDPTRMLLRMFGYGVPSYEKASYCISNRLVMISEASLKPFVLEEGKSSVSMNEMHIYELPWPVDVLESLGDTEVKLRITLSYYVDPSPDNIGWQSNNGYPSHRLKFDMNTPLEEKEKFILRIGKDSDEKPDTSNNSTRWAVGPQERNRGSVNSDIWIGPASEISKCGIIAVYPASGWWKNRKHLEMYDNEARYSIIISIETPVLEESIYDFVDNIVRNKQSIVI
ncbi:conserved hypothetical protein [Denitrovibrio acetiphilus DSM 12809]|uniref:Peptidase S8/S53 domain-containing protein n=1 Tax=Denitrovibrio acetiphilus (strain DSM 12809 / NBRC 114555 / N2460) TaxID=522772 RepID=D4H4Q0_DENA2|nr:S8 family peptidase [Denitrovibrio acetiphilus]ADD67444.1 conserved hypothetical protein [Denitrovibrio acetiphilus DSM 12809]